MEKAFDRELRDVLWWTLRKLGMEKWLVKIPQSIYRNARSHGRVNGTFSDDFLAPGRIASTSVLHPLLCIIVLEALSRNMRS